MKLPLSWLHDFCRPALDARTLAERLAMTGTEVERVHSHGVSALEFFVVGQVLEAEQHPDADRLRVCQVAVGEGAVAGIVCGAPNVAAGQTVAVARPGAVMPDGTKLKAAKLRGVRSEGMILAEDELAIGVDHDGILVLPGDLAPGTPLADVLPIATEVLELEITPNRPDCLGVYGVAREVHAATGAPLAAPPWRADPGTPGPVDGVEISVEAPDLCPRFTARAFEGVTVAPSPPWLKARLMAAGQRPISNVVDITNYVMLLTGQPLHAFDLDRVGGGRLVVRRARDGEQVETLDGTTRTLDGEMVVIDDADGPTSIAGVMGGARSEVSSSTGRVLMEAATWNGPNINRTSTRLALRSEASGRFEKQLQPEQALEAQAVATQLMIDLCGARVVPGTIDIGGPGPALVHIHVRDARVSGLLGVEVPRSRARQVLEALEFGVEDADDGLEVAVPSFRRDDVTREADVIEEIARLDALERLPSTLPSGRHAVGSLTPRQHMYRRAADALTDRGLHEIVGWSFTRPGLDERLRLPGAVELLNPMSEDESVLRTRLLGSLLDAARLNAARGGVATGLFEVGTVYRDTGEALPRERRHLGVVLAGAGGFFAAKGIAEALLTTLRADVSYEPASEPFLHPGRAAHVLLSGEEIGWVGEVHPLLAGEWELGGAAAFELDLDAVPVPPTRVFADLTRFPPLREDLAVVVEEEVSAGALVATMRSAGRLLVGAEVFDVYRGPQVGEGRKSLAVHLSYWASDRTLNDEDAARERGRILDAVRDQLGGELRA